MRCLILVSAVLALATAAAATERPPEQARQRVEHHLRHVDQLAQHFETLLNQDCQRFPSAREWRAYFDAQVDRVVTLLAHVEQAWLEAKRTGDDDVRRTAKAPRKRVEQARGLVDKLQGCAADHGSGFSHLAVWRRIEHEVPQRQVEIALPE